MLLPAEPPHAQQMRVRIPVWTAEAGASLTPEDVSATVDGQQAPVLRLQGPDDDMMVLIVLDLVSDLSRIDLARDAMVAALAEMPPNAHIGLLRAQDGLRVLQDPTTDHEALIQAIRTMTVRGTPGLLETIGTASELADSILAKAPVRMAIYYITDSDIREYREDFTNPVINQSDQRDLSRRFPEGLVRERISKIEQQLSSSQVPIFVVHLQHSVDRFNEAYQSGLMQLATTTGGSAVFCRSNAEIATAIDETFRRIVNHYSLDLAVPDTDGDSVEISLKSTSGSLSYRGRVTIRR